MAKIVFNVPLCLIWLRSEDIFGVQIVRLEFFIFEVKLISAWKALSQMTR